MDQDSTSLTDTQSSSVDEERPNNDAPMPFPDTTFQSAGVSAMANLTEGEPAKSLGHVSPVSTATKRKAEDPGGPSQVKIRAASMDVVEKAVTESSIIDVDDQGSMIVQTDSTEEDDPTEIYYDAESGDVRDEETNTNKSRILKPEDLEEHIMPVLVKLCEDPESERFFVPPETFFRYLNVIEGPMSLLKIISKLKSGAYEDPWNIINDVRLVFQNSQVFGHRTRLFNKFSEEIDPAMKNLGYCCGRQYKFNPPTLYCYRNRPSCKIEINDNYYVHQNKYIFCCKCFRSFHGDLVKLKEDGSEQEIVLRKEQFTRMKNECTIPEPFVECRDCKRKFHQICVLHMDQIWCKGFICENCLNAKNEKREENRFNAKNLPISVSSAFIEKRINDILQERKLAVGRVTVRVVSNTEKFFKVLPKTKSRFVECEKLPQQFPYNAKTILAFEEIDGVDVCFLRMQTEECNSECSAPNARSVFISTFDTTAHFQSGDNNRVRDEILLSYLEYVKRLGYVKALIQAYPRRDSIFPCLPDNRTHSLRTLTKLKLEIMNRALDRGIISRNITDYRDTFRNVMYEKLLNVAELPYFEGDYWPYELEKIIEELDQEEKQRKTGVAKDASVAGTENKLDLTSRIYHSLEKRPADVLVIKLCNVPTVSSLPPIQDTDPLIICDLMDGPASLFQFAQERNYEFSCLRRAKFSSMAMLYELHTRSQYNVLYSCKRCQTGMKTRYRCIHCSDFNLCVYCYFTYGHAHEMDELNFALFWNKNAPTEIEINTEAAKTWSKWLFHAFCCKATDSNCTQPDCQRMKRVIKHLKGCSLNLNPRKKCNLCLRLMIEILGHAKFCQDTKCEVVLCNTMKEKLEFAKTLRAEEEQRLQCDNESDVPMMSGSGSISSSVPSYSYLTSVLHTNPAPQKANPHSLAASSPLTTQQQSMISNLVAIMNEIANDVNLPDHVVRQMAQILQRTSTYEEFRDQFKDIAKTHQPLMNAILKHNEELVEEARVKVQKVRAEMEKLNRQYNDLSSLRSQLSQVQEMVEAQLTYENQQQSKTPSKIHSRPSKDDMASLLENVCIHKPLVVDDILMGRPQ